MFPHRVANLATRGVGDLFGEPARPEPRLKDPFDGACVEGAVLGRVLDRRNDVVDRPYDLQRRGGCGGRMTVRVGPPLVAEAA
jgi:hypothetical protein